MSGDHYTHCAQLIVSIATILAASPDTEKPAPPSREAQENIDKKLKQVEAAHKLEKDKLDENSEFIVDLKYQLRKFEASLEVPERQIATAKANMAAAAKTPDPADDHSARRRYEQILALNPDIEKMRAALDRQKAILKEREKEVTAGTTSLNALKDELQDVMRDYFKTANPKMIAERFKIPFHGIDFDYHPESLDLTRTPVGNTRHYGLAVEPAWDSHYEYTDKGGTRRSLELKAITQHEHVTTQIMYDTTRMLLQRKVPGISPPVGRVGLMVDDYDLKQQPNAHLAIFGHPVDGFRASVLNNSTRSYAKLHDPEVFHAALDLFTKDTNIKTITVDNATITYGVPPVGRPILSNSAGNTGWHGRPEMTIQKNFYPFRLKIGAAAIPAMKEANRRDDKAPIEIEEYSAGCGVDAVAQRPRWNKDGTPVKTQYLSPKYKEIIEENLWRLLVDKPMPRSPRDLYDETQYPLKLVNTLKEAHKEICAAVRNWEGVCPEGKTDNMMGTSFATPVVAGAILDARIKFPDASEVEIIDAFLSSCVPITHRKPVLLSVRDDVPHLVDKKSGWRFSPRGAGYGEFIINPDATAANPDSWMKMEEYLKRMQDARGKLTENGNAQTKIKIGHGAYQRVVERNGQPPPMTMKITGLKDTPTKEMQATTQRLHDTVIDAFKKSDMHACTSALDADGIILKHLQAREYHKALEAYRQDYVVNGFVSEHDPYYTAMRAAIKQVENQSAYTYSVNVPVNHDLCCTFAALRLKFKNSGQTDEFIVLESPDGRKVPVTMSYPTEGVEVGSTSGFMRQSAVGSDAVDKDNKGRWKIHTRQPLDTEHSTLVLYGTERNVANKIIDVRETVLSEIEKKEADKRTNLPDKNILTITDPHQLLRQWNLIEQAPPAKKIRTMPATREGHLEYMQELLDQSELRKGGFIPEGTLKPSKAPDRKTGWLGTGLPMDKLLASLASEFSAPQPATPNVSPGHNAQHPFASLIADNAGHSTTEPSTLPMLPRKPRDTRREGLITSA